jgi:hypothetical protein
MQALVIFIVKSDSARPPRRQVAAGKLGPGIARIVLDELYAEREGIVETNGVEVEVANG